MPGRIEPVNAIAILGILGEEPRSGYDLLRTLGERGGGLLDVPAGTLYYALKCFEKRGWVAGASERRGKRPERRVFRLTAAGRKAFANLLEETAFAPDRMVSPFDVALFFAPHLAPETLLRAIERREAHVAASLEGIHRVEEHFPDRWPFHLYYLKEKTKEIAEIQARWCGRLRRKLREKSVSRV
jgi:DNA-binding PadR family transcriptional regulator